VIKIVFQYVGPHGRHTEVYQDGELVRGYFFTDTSPLLLLWIACDLRYQNVADVLKNETDYPRRDDISESILARVGDRSLFSKYDVVYDTQAIPNAYLYLKDLKLARPIESILDYMDKLIKKICNELNDYDLEIEYGLDDRDIYKSWNLQP